jgi:hypothetical protein
MRQIRFVVPEGDALVAFQELQAALLKVREGSRESPAKQSSKFSVFAVSLFDEKLKTGEIKSAAGREKWGMVLEHHLIPAFGEVRVDQIRHADGASISAGMYSPNTANTWIDVLKVIMKRAVAEFELPRNPMDGLRKFDASTHATYTEEQPNSLTSEEVTLFVAKLKELYPQHFAFACLGFFLGHRPSTLRPLRRGGATPDFDPATGVLLVRRSQTRGDEVMETTKTKIRQRIVLPPLLVEILRAHADALPEGPMRDSELLFPAEDGSFRSPSSLRCAFKRVVKEIGLMKKLTAKGMRRTFQDLCREAEVKDIVTRSISGHSTETMQHHYSTVAANEKSEAIAKVIDLTGVGRPIGARSGDEGAVAAAE